MAACHIDPVATTTYRGDYRVEKFLPAIRMTTLPMFQPGREVNTCQWRPSVKKVPMPPSTQIFARYEPSRKRADTCLLQNPEACKKKPAPGLKKRQFMTKFGTMDSVEMDRLAHQLKWTPTTKVATQEAHLPLPQNDGLDKSLEPRSDMVRFDAHRYDVKPRLWQQAELFDRFQIRAPVERVVYPYDNANQTKLLTRRGKSTPEPPNADKIRQQIHSGDIATIYIRQCPGYAGYVPQVPPKSNSNKPNTVCPSMLSTMQATYREIPQQEFSTRQHVRSGPFSKMVTLTAPFNPYNKV